MARKIVADFAVMAGSGFSGDAPFEGPVAVAVREDRIVWVGTPENLAAEVEVAAPSSSRPEASEGGRSGEIFPTSESAAGAAKISRLRAARSARDDEMGTAARSARDDVEGLPVLEFPDCFLMPGFHDAHIHMFHSALYHSDLAERYCGASEADAVARLAPLAARRPAGGWLLTQGWRDYLWEPPVTPSKASLDAAYPDRPVAMYSGDAHTLWLNSCALDRLGITEDSVPPAGGSYDKDENGQLTGIVREAAAMALMPKIVGEFSREELLDAYRGLFARLNAEGITSVCDVSLMALPGLDFVRDDLYEDLLAAGDLTVRVHLFPTLLEGTTRLAELQEKLTDPLLRAQGYKQFFDGVSSQHTAWVHDPYSNPHFPGDNGRPTVDPQVMEHLLAEARAEGQPVRIHAIGDEAIHQLLNFFESSSRPEAEGRSGEIFPGSDSASGAAKISRLRAARSTRDDEMEDEGGSDPKSDVILSVARSAESKDLCEKSQRPHDAIEHLENFQPADMARLARLGVVASVQPRHITLDPGGPERDLGPERVPFMWPFRTLLDEGAVLAFGTDSPVTATNPLDAVYTAVTRRDADSHQPEGGWLPEERITTEEALRAYTVGSATAASREEELGRIAPGQFADFILLDRNLLTADPEVIQQATPQATFVAGRRVY